MEVQELKKLIKEDNIPKFLIFTGEEWKIQQEYIKQIAKVKQLSISYAESIDEVWEELKAQSLFGTDTLYILRDDKELLHNEKIQERLLDVLNNNMLILTLTSADKRLKMLKTYKDSIVEFNALTDAILTQYIQREIALSNRNCQILIDICEHNYGRILLEIDKIRSYISADRTDNTTMDHDTSFMQLLKQGVIYVPPKDTMWDFIKAFLQNKPLVAYTYYIDLKELNTPILVILSNLYNNTKALLQVQTCTSNNIEKSTGLLSWQIRNAKECINRYSDEDLTVLLKFIQMIEKNIKIGKIDEQIAIDYLFSTFF